VEKCELVADLSKGTGKQRGPDQHCLGQSGGLSTGPKSCLAANFKVGWSASEVVKISRLTGVVWLELLLCSGDANTPIVPYGCSSGSRLQHESRFLHTGRYPLGPSAGPGRELHLGRAFRLRCIIFESFMSERLKVPEVQWRSSHPATHHYFQCNKRSNSLRVSVSPLCLSSCVIDEQRLVV
jgi:hypothetical protein